jgi:hypothetical protein
MVQELKTVAWAGLATADTLNRDAMAVIATTTRFVQGRRERCWVCTEPPCRGCGVNIDMVTFRFLTGHGKGRQD